MVWAGIAHRYRTPLVVIQGNLNVRRYREDILAPYVVPLLRNNGNIRIFQQNNATSYTARDTVRYTQAQNIDFINDWPSKSPDVNPIEHLWDNLDQRVRRLQNPPKNANELQQEWNNILQAVIHKLVNSMRQRCVSVVNAQGGHTRY